MTPTARNLLATVRANPGDTTARMVYADALEEAGDEEGAHLQRAIAEPHDDGHRLALAAELERTAGEVKCELCKGNGYYSVRERGEYGPNHYRSDCLACNGTGRVSDGRAELAAFIRVQVGIGSSYCAQCKGDGRYYEDGGPYESRWVKCRCELSKLRARERELWPAVRGAFEGEGAVPVLNGSAFANDEASSPGNAIVIVSGGLPRVVRCTLAEWMGGECATCGGTRLMHYRPPRGANLDAMGSVENCPGCHGEGRTPGIGPKLAQRWPIERVEVVDITDFGFDSDGLWLAANLPSDLTGKIPNHGIFPTDDGRSFADWLSDALIAWARSQPTEEGRS